MVATIDGKIITGERGEPVQDLGSETDHLMMRRIQSSVDAVLIGAENQRSSPKIWYPTELIRIVVTRSGNVLYPSRFFDDAPQKAIVLCPRNTILPKLPEEVKVLEIGEDSVEWMRAMGHLTGVKGINSLLVEGGSEVNAQLLKLNLADELFLTLAPKVKLGANTPTYADGDPLPRKGVQNYRLIESHVWNDEVFLRYRRTT
jgi:riboflavin biosynthesis pyrimidine reductase